MQTCALSSSPPSPDRHRIVTSLDGLTAILDPNVNLCVVRRGLDPEVEAALANLASGERVKLHGVVHPGAPAEVTAVLSALPAGLARDFLTDDIQSLAARVAALAGTARPRVGLETVVTDACRKWHGDFVGLRLIVTYAGLGTHWAPESAIDRRWLGSIEGDMDEANGRILCDPAEARVVERGDVLVCKGDAFPGNAGRGAVHRSPPLRGFETRRLVLKIDDVPCNC
jgi:hypothetical protein